MALELYLVDDLIRLAAAGTGFRIDATLRQTDDLIRFAGAAARGGRELHSQG